MARALLASGTVARILSQPGTGRSTPFTQRTRLPRCQRPGISASEAPLAMPGGNLTGASKSSLPRILHAHDVREGVIRRAVVIRRDCVIVGCAAADELHRNVGRSSENLDAGVIQSGVLGNRRAAVLAAAGRDEVTNTRLIRVSVAGVVDTVA